MEHIKIYKPPDGPAQVAEFIEGLELRLLASLWDHPECAVEYIVKEEKRA